MVKTGDTLSQINSEEIQKMSKAKLRKRHVKLKIARKALELFAKKGYFQTTIEEIAKSAGVSKGLIFFYFDTKTDLLQFIIERNMTKLITILESISQSSLPTKEKLRHFILTEMKFYLKNKDFYNLILQFTKEGIFKILKSNLYEKYTRYKTLEFEILTSIIKEGINKGIFKPSFEPQNVTLVLTGILHSLTLFPIAQRFNVEINEKNLNKLIDIVFNGILKT